MRWDHGNQINRLHWINLSAIRTWIRATSMEMCRGKCISGDSCNSGLLEKLVEIGTYSTYRSKRSQFRFDNSCEPLTILSFLKQNNITIGSVVRLSQQFNVAELPIANVKFKSPNQTLDHSIWIFTGRHFDDSNAFRPMWDDSGKGVPTTIRQLGPHTLCIELGMWKSAQLSRTNSSK